MTLFDEPSPIDEKAEAKKKAEARVEAVIRDVMGGVTKASPVTPPRHRDDATAASPAVRPRVARAPRAHHLGSEPPPCDESCRLCKGVGMSVCSGARMDPPRCWVWPLPCRMLKTHGGYHHHLCPVGQKLREQIQGD